MSKEAIDRLREKSQNEKTVLDLAEVLRLERQRVAELQAENQRMFVALHEDYCKDFANCNKGCEHLVKQLRAEIARGTDDGKAS